jgi:DNA-binding transcriptional LysR family regulator
VVLARLAAAEAELEAIAGVRGGRVRIASFSTAGASLVPPALALFERRHPEVELQFLEGEPEEAIQMMRAGDLELAVVFEFHDLSPTEWDRIFSGVELHHLIDDPMYLALPRDHPLAHKPRVRLQDAAGETWIQEGDPRNPCGRLQKSACRTAGFEPTIGFQSDDYNVVQGLVAAGVGVSLLPSLALANMRDDIVVRSLGRTAPKRRICAATLSERYRSPATEAMLQVLQEVSASFQLPSGTAVAAA